MILLGDCLVRLKELEANSVDSVVTDPPYGLSFMGKKWDYDVPSEDIWRCVFRVLKPGGHLHSFGGSRTYHRIATNIELAGFEIRDQIQWLYGSGFPKSHDISKGIDKAAGAEQVEKGRAGRDAPQFSGKYNNGEIYEGKNAEAGFAQGRWPANLLLDETAAEMLDEQSGTLKSGMPGIKSKGNDSAAYGAESRPPGSRMSGFGDSGGASRFFYVAKASKRERNAGLEGMEERVRNITQGHGRGAINTSKGDGSGIRENKPCANIHPTVKPIKLMEYLIKLITPPGGTCLDPFMGSGSTGVAAFRLGFKFIGIEMNEEYVEIAEKRIEHASSEGA